MAASIWLISASATLGTPAELTPFHQSIWFGRLPVAHRKCQEASGGCGGCCRFRRARLSPASAGAALLPLIVPRLSVLLLLLPPVLFVVCLFGLLAMMPSDQFRI